MTLSPTTGGWKDAAVTSTSAAPGRIDVLVVDDEDDVASTTAEILERAGLTAATTATLGEARELITSHDVGSVILDHQVADANAPEFLAVDADLPPIIVISGIGRDVLAEFEANYGDRVFACRGKPVPPHELIEVVRAALSSTRS
jgi:DNA-binding NtrC family response regulator